MNAQSAVDTNLLTHAFEAGDPRQPAAVGIRRRASVTQGCVLALQSLGEFVVVARRRKLLSPQVAAQQVDRWLTSFPTAPAPDAAALRAALAPLA